MDYRIEVYDAAGCRVALCEDSPLFEAVRGRPDEADLIRGILPGPVTRLSHGYLVKVFVDGAPFCQGRVTRVLPEWSDARKLILERYVSFHEVIAFEAEGEVRAGNTAVTQAYMNRPVSTVVKHLINCAPGTIHYGVAHTGYPDGARREYGKFEARRTPANELESGGIAHGQWVDASRIDATHAWAKDGDTISGLVIDGVAWPDLRLMMVDAEEISNNPHAWRRHPEVAAWSNERYAASGYQQRAVAAQRALQALLDTKGIDYIELNPHRDIAGLYDDRVDAYGRYVGFVYGGGECLNAALVEQGCADVGFYEGGAYLVPEMELKDYFSYTGPCIDTVEDATNSVTAFDVGGGVLEAITALAYVGNGYVWSVSPELLFGFRRATMPDHVFCYDPTTMRVGLGSDSREVANVLYVGGNPVTASLNKAYRRSASADEYGVRVGQLNHFSFTLEEDADHLAAGLLDDIAYPEPCGALELYRGAAQINVGDIVEVRDTPLRRLEREVDGEWGGRFTGKLVGRVRRVTHRFSGKQVSTVLDLGSPLRSVSSPLGFMVRGQEAASTLYEFRLDTATVGLGMGYHLD